MPGFPVPFIKYVQYDANGFPLAGGKLYSYKAGLSDPLPTYTTQKLDVPNTNPIILDASGRASVFIPDGVGYKFVQMDALNNILWTEDNVQVPLTEFQELPGAPPVVKEVPTGLIVMWGAASPPRAAGAVEPFDWLLCDGAGYSRSIYSALYGIIGETFGTGNGSTTFNVPDMRQRFPLGKAASGAGSILGINGVGGMIDHTHAGPLHQHTIPAHTHQIAGHQHSVPHDGWSGSLHINDSRLGWLRIGATPNSGGADQSPWMADWDHITGVNASTTSGFNTDGLLTNTEGTGQTQGSNPPFLPVNFLIKT